MMSALREAREMLLEESRWCQRQIAKDGNGFRVSPTDPRARQWCAVGAYIAAARLGTDAINGFRVLQAQALELFGRDITQVNDLIGHEAVIQCFDKALVELEGGL